MAYMSGIWYLFIWIFIQHINADRAHKVEPQKNPLQGDIFSGHSISEGTFQDQYQQVHNLILYPDQHEWCEARDIEMVLTYPGCTPKAFQNKVCVGQCFSYTSPRTRPPNQVEDKLKYCHLCRPSNSTWHKVVLTCDTDRYTIFEQEVELIHECECDSCFPDAMVTKLLPPDSYIYEYEDAYYDYNIPDTDIDLSDVVRQQINSGTNDDPAVGAEEAGGGEDSRFVAFSLDQQTLEQMARINGHNERGQQRQQHHNRVVFNSRTPSARHWQAQQEDGGR